MAQLKIELVEVLTKMFSKENMEKDAFFEPYRTGEKGQEAVPFDTLCEEPRITAVTDRNNIVRMALYECKNCYIEKDLTVHHWSRPEQNTLILRDLSSDTPKEGVISIFNPSKAGAGSDILGKLENAVECPPVVSVRSDVNNMWFVAFETEAACKEALLNIRNVKYEGKKLSARLKTASTKPVYTGLFLGSGTGGVSAEGTPYNGQSPMDGFGSFFNSPTADGVSQGGGDNTGPGGRGQRMPMFMPPYALQPQMLVGMSVMPGGIPHGQMMAPMMPPMGYPHPGGQGRHGGGNRGAGGGKGGGNGGGRSARTGGHAQGVHGGHSEKNGRGGSKQSKQQQQQREEEHQEHQQREDQSTLPQQQQQQQQPPSVAGDVDQPVPMTDPAAMAAMGGAMPMNPQIMQQIMAMQGYPLQQGVPQPAGMPIPMGMGMFGGPHMMMGMNPMPGGMPGHPQMMPMHVGGQAGGMAAGEHGAFINNQGNRGGGSGYHDGRSSSGSGTGSAGDRATGYGNTGARGGRDGESGADAKGEKDGSRQRTQGGNAASSGGGEGGNMRSTNQGRGNQSRSSAGSDKRQGSRRDEGGEDAPSDRRKRNPGGGREGGGTPKNSGQGQQRAAKQKAFTDNDFPSTGLTASSGGAGAPLPSIGGGAWASAARRSTASPKSSEADSGSAPTGGRSADRPTSAPPPPASTSGNTKAGVGVPVVAPKGGRTGSRSAEPDVNRDGDRKESSSKVPGSATGSSGTSITTDALVASSDASPADQPGGATDEFIFGAFSAPIKVASAGSSSSSGSGSRGGEGAATTSTGTSMNEDAPNGVSRRSATSSNSVGVGSSSESIRAATHAATLAAAEAKGAPTSSSGNVSTDVGSGADASSAVAPEGPSAAGGAWGAKRSFLDVVRTTSDK